MQPNTKRSTWWDRWKPTARRPTSPIVWYLLGFLVVVAVAGLLSVVRNNASGDLQADGLRLGAFTLHAQGCDSGQRSQFHGVTFYDYGQHGFAGRIVLPEDGSDHITLNIPGKDAGETFLREECSMWNVDLHPGLSYANNVRTMQGYARFRCAHADGSGTIQGDLRFRGCH